MRQFGGKSAPRLFVFAAYAVCLLLTEHTFVVTARAVAPYDGQRPQIEATRIAREEAPTIDGDLSDPAWQKAARTDRFYQVFPQEGAEPSQKTVAYIMFDDKTIYVAFEAFESEMDKVAASVGERDGGIFKDDSVRVMFDTYGTGRDGFVFHMNSIGARQESLVENNVSLAGEWDTIWKAKTKTLEDRWIVEVSIPFQSISYDPNLESWSVDFDRRITRGNETIRWSAINRSISPFDISQAGTLTGIRDIDKGIGVDAQAFLSGRWQRHWPDPYREDDFLVEPSGNVFYKITPSLTGLVTINTDFSDAPLDERRINTSRFSLFFPEERDFFLQDASLFEFGGRPFNEEQPNGRPFFSRNIGLVRGEPTDLLAGAKLSGSVGPYNIAAFSSLVGEHDEIGSQALSVARLSADVLNESRLGMIITNGDPLGEIENTVVGADFQYLDSTLFGNQRLQADFFFMRSMSSDDNSTGNSFGTEFALPNDKYNARVLVKQIDKEFDPRLGFVLRPGTRQYEGQLRYRHRQRGWFLRSFDIGTEWDIFTDLSNVVLTRINEARTRIEFHSGDRFTFKFIDRFEKIRSDFILPNDLTVPTGEYHFQRGHMFYDGFFGNPFSLELEVECCTWFDGDRLDVDAEAEWRISPFLKLLMKYEYVTIDNPRGSIEVHIADAGINLNFTPDMQFASQIQYDNISEDFNYLGRFQWEIRPETELFVSYSHEAETDLDRFTSETSGATIRIGNTFRY